MDVGCFHSLGLDMMHIISTGISLVRIQSHGHSYCKGAWENLSSCVARRKRNQVGEDLESHKTSPFFQLDLSTLLECNPI